MSAQQSHERNHLNSGDGLTPIARLHALAQEFENAVGRLSLSENGPIHHWDDSGGAESDIKEDKFLLLKRIIKTRQMRAKFFPPDLFAEPMWDIMLDLMVARMENQQVSVSSACIAASVPTTTALRSIKALVEHGLAERFQDPSDGRRSFVRLTDSAAQRMSELFAINGF